MMIRDLTDPNPARRYKLFSNKYFTHQQLPNPDTGDVGTVQAYWLGAIVMFTASSPDGTWSAETPVLGWTFTPPEIPLLHTTANTINLIDPTNLGTCIQVAEGSASVNGGGAADFVFACTYIPSSGVPTQNIVLLRMNNLAVLGTANPGNSFQYISTPLSPSDSLSPTFISNYNAPTLLRTQDNAPVLIATPQSVPPLYRGAPGNQYMGCMVFPFASEQAGTLIRDQNNKPIPIVYLPAQSATVPPSPTPTDYSGACAWDRGLTAPGVSMTDNAVAVINGIPYFTFKILITKKSF